MSGTFQPLSPQERRGGEDSRHPHVFTVKASLGVTLLPEHATLRVTEGRGGTHAQKAFHLSSRLGRRRWDNMAGP